MIRLNRVCEVNKIMRIVIADDEMHVRKRLETRVKWNELGFEEPILCADGDELLEELLKNGADVVLTDIRMPRMDGIDAVREARKVFTQLEVILMSAYDDKEYLKSALDLHVLGYLEKPFSIEQVSELLHQTLQGFNEKKEQENQIGIAKENWRYDCLTQAAKSLCRFQNQDEIQHTLSKVYPEFASASSYCAILIQSRAEELEYLPMEESARFFRRMEKEGWCGICTGMKHGGIVIFLAHSEDKVNRILQQLSNDPDHDRKVIAVGSCVSDIAMLYHSYQDAVITLERHFYHNRTILRVREREHETKAYDAKMLEDGQESFLFALNSKNRIACCSYLEELRDTLKKYDATLVRVAKNYYFKLAIYVLQSRKQKNAGVSEYYLWELIYQSRSIDELHHFLMELLEKNLTQEEALSGTSGVSGISIDVILNYIEENLQNPELSLNQISRTYYVSVTYLCVFFKEKTGMTIKNYIIGQRMKKAAKLLAYTDMKIADVAYAVGFSDQCYFAKSFGRYFGESPSCYREEMHEKE